MQGKKNERPGVQAKKRSSAVRSREKMIPRWALAGIGGVLVGFGFKTDDAVMKAVLVLWGLGLATYALLWKKW